MRLLTTSGPQEDMQRSFNSSFFVQHLVPSSLAVPCLSFLSFFFFGVILNLDFPDMTTYTIRIVQTAQFHPGCCDTSIQGD